MIEFSAITKSFSGTPVLKGVSFVVPAGHTLGLVGENGAGKSTLMNILGGNQLADSGGMRLDGAPYAPRNTQDAARHGVAFIHQELNLFSNLSIAENLFLMAFPTRGGLPWIDRSALRKNATALLQQVGLEISPDTLVEKLSSGEQQLVEIAKALALQARLIIFDEPTTSLTHQETERLFALIAQLKSRGLSLIYISHTLEDVLRLSDEIVVLRDGELIANGPKAEFTIDRMVSLMAGRDIAQLFPPRSPAPANEPLLEVRHLSQPGMAADISFTLHRGEVLGLSGLMGSGRSELARMLFGIDPFTHGQVLLEGQPIASTPRGNIRCGLGFLTENRREEGLCLEASIADNLALVTLQAHGSRLLGWLDRAGIGRCLAQICQAVRLAPAAGLEQPAKILSGGNQQKVVLAKWLLANPKVFILDEPTRGIDVGAKHEIYQLISELSARGTGVLLISSELEELTGLCDRILVLHRGEISGEFTRPDYDRKRLLTAALGGSNQS